MSRVGEPDQNRPWNDFQDETSVVNIRRNTTQLRSPVLSKGEWKSLFYVQMLKKVFVIAISISVPVVGINILTTPSTPFKNASFSGLS